MKPFHVAAKQGSKRTMKVILDFGKMDNVNEHFLTFSALGTT
jgi:hypothetical protein